MSFRRNVGVILGLGCAIGAFAVARARAGVVTVFHEELADSDPFEIIQSKFRVNEERPDLGRAWVDVTQRKKFANGEDGPEETTLSRNVAGLTFDAASGEIRYQEGSGKPTVCAKLEQKHFLFIHWKKIEETGSCVMSGHVVDANVDDGFRVRVRPFAEVKMEVNPDGKVAETKQEDRFPASVSVSKRISHGRER